MHPPLAAACFGGREHACGCLYLTCGAASDSVFSEHAVLLHRLVRGVLSLPYAVVWAIWFDPELQRSA
jgi:hypothetical protein